MHLKLVLAKLSLHRKAHRRLIKDESSYLYQTGWMASLEQKQPIDCKGNFIPWMNYSVVKFLEERLTHELKLFEYGSGYSSYFYAERVQSITSLEYDQEWYEHLKPNIPDNVTMVLQKDIESGRYSQTINDMNNKYDLVVVDGRDRVNCVKQAFKALSLNGVILLDDSHRERYQEALIFSRNQGYRILNFEGLKATGTQIDQTSIIYTDNNCLGI